MRKILLVGMGGFLGAVLRYLASGLAYRLAPFSTFPHGTLVVNVTGCLAMGFLAGVAESRQVLSADSRAFLLLGLLGAFTTFSTFGHETFELARDREAVGALANVGLHLFAGLAAVWAGHILARSL